MLSSELSKFHLNNICFVLLLLGSWQGAVAAEHALPARTAASLARTAASPARANASKSNRSSDLNLKNRSSAKRSVASTASGLPSDNHASEIRITQKFDIGGHVLSEILTAADYSEFTTDPGATGIHEIWEVSEPNKGITFRASNPLDGRYQTVEIEQKRKTGKVILRYAYDNKRRVFALRDSEFKVNRSMFASQNAIVDKKDANGNFILTCSENQGVYKSANAWLDIMKKISKGDEQKTQAFMSCYLKRYRNAFFDPKCYSGAFAGSFDDLQKGIVQVFASSYPTDGKAVYLQCLTKQGFSTHTARIESLISGLSQSLRIAIANDKAMQEAHGDWEKMKGLCDTPYSIDGLANRPVAPFSCEENNTTGEMAEYRPGTGGSDQIVFHRTKANILANPVLVSDYGLPSTPVSNVYASYFFHESLHQSMIDNETVVYGLQNCCDGRPGEHSGDCAKAQRYANDVGLTDRYESSFEASLPGFKNARENIGSAFGADDDLQSAMMKAYYAGFDSHKATAESSYMSCTSARASTPLQTPVQTRASNSVCDAVCKNECSKAYLNQMARFTKDWFNDANYCPIYRSRAQNPTSINCSDLGGQMAALMSNVSDSKVVGAADGAHSVLEGLTVDQKTAKRSAIVPATPVLVTVAAGANNVTPTAGAIGDAVNGSNAGLGSRPTSNGGIAAPAVSPAISPATAPSAGPSTAQATSPATSPAPARPTTAPLASNPPSLPILGAGGSQRADGIPAGAGGRVVAGRTVLSRANDIADSFMPTARAANRIDVAPGSGRGEGSSDLRTEPPRFGATRSELASTLAPINPAAAAPISLDEGQGITGIRAPASVAVTPSLVSAAVAQASRGSVPEDARLTKRADINVGKPTDVTNEQNAPTKRSGRQSEQIGGVSQTAPERKLGVGLPIPGISPLKGPASAAGNGTSAAGLDFSSADRVRRIIVGDYVTAHGYLHGSSSSEFTAALKQYHMHISENISESQKFSYGSNTATVRFEYCHSNQRFVDEGACK